jgi:hypothetical protein
MDALHAYASSSSDDEEDHDVPQKIPAAPVLPPPRTAPYKNDQVGGSMLLWSKRYDTNAVLPSSSSTSAAAVVGAVVGKPAERHWVMPGPPVEEWETVDRLMKLELAARMGPAKTLASS